MTHHFGTSQAPAPSPAIWTERDIFIGSLAVQVGKHVYHVTRLSHPGHVTIFRKAERTVDAEAPIAPIRRSGMAKTPTSRWEGGRAVWEGPGALWVWRTGRALWV